MFVVVSLFIVYIENNIESIISNKFSQNKSYNLSIDDVDFSLSGKFTLNNFLILDKNNDSIIYSEKISVDPISLSKAIYNEEYNFKNINFIDGFINIKYLLGPSISNIDLKKYSSTSLLSKKLQRYLYSSWLCKDLTILFAFKKANSCALNVSGLLFESN